MPEPHSADVVAVAAPEPQAARRLIMIALALSLVVALFGLGARMQMIAWGLVFPGPVNVFFRLYAFHEALPLMLIVAWTVVAAAILVRRAPVSNGNARLERLSALNARAVGVVAALLFVVALVTWYRVHHAVLLTMDEFTSDFQARILARGELRATVPPESVKLELSSVQSPDPDPPNHS